MAMTVDDPLEGQELQMLNAMLIKIYPLAREGDSEMIDRVIKIMQLKRRYHGDLVARADEWKL